MYMWVLGLLTQPLRVAERNKSTNKKQGKKKILIGQRARRINWGAASVDCGSDGVNTSRHTVKKWIGKHLEWVAYLHLNFKGLLKFKANFFKVQRHLYPGLFIHTFSMQILQSFKSLLIFFKVTNSRNKILILLISLEVSSPEAKY